MKASKYTEAQIIAILRHAEGSVPVADLCREHGTSNGSFYKRRAKYGGMYESMISQMKAIEEENRRLRQMYAGLSIEADLLKGGPWKKVTRPGLHAPKKSKVSTFHEGLVKR